MSLASRQVPIFKLYVYIDLRFNIIGDIKSIEKRLFFENGKDMVADVA